MTQYVINIGSVPNDGTGDPLRTAFNEVNLNFNQVWATGLVNSNIQVANNTILTTNTNGNLILNPNGIGSVIANAHVIPDQNRIRNLGSPTSNWNTLYAYYGNIQNANITTANIGNIGNITVGVANLHITGGSNGYVLQTDGTGNLTWTAQTGGSGNGTPGGANTQVQFNDAGSFGGQAGFTYDKVSNILSVPTKVVTNEVAGGQNGTLGQISFPLGNAQPLDIINNTGNVVLITNTSSYNQWQFDTTGTLSFPDNSGASWPINQQRFGMGNIGAWLDGQWTIGEFSGNGVSGQVGIRIDPAIEGNTGISFPGSVDSVTQPVQIYNTGGGGIGLYTGGNNWAFAADGNLIFPNNASISVIGNITNFNTGANGFLGLNSFDAGGNNIARVAVNSIDGLVGIATYDPVTDYDYGWTFDKTGNLTIPGNILLPTYGPYPHPSISADANANINIVAPNSIVLGANYSGNNFRFGADGNLTIPSGIIGNGNLYVYPDANNLGGRLDIFLTYGPDVHIAGVGENLILGRDDGANVTVGVDGAVTIQTTNFGNTYVWNFGQDGNLTTAGNIQAINTGFAFRSAIIDMTAGNPTVVITLADSPFPDPVSGTVTISGVTGTTEANGVWGFQATNDNEFELYTDSTLTTPVDGTTWTAYTGGGYAISAGYKDLAIKGGNVSVKNGLDDTWLFRDDGTTVFPTLTTPDGGQPTGNWTAPTMRIGDGINDGVISTPDGTPTNSYTNLILQPGQGYDDGRGGKTLIFGGRGGPTAGSGGGDVRLHGGYATGGGSGGDIELYLGPSADANNTGTVRIVSTNGDSLYQFNNDGSLTPLYKPTNQRTGYGLALVIGDQNTQAVITGPAPVANAYNSAPRLVVAGQDGVLDGEGGDIYLWAGRSGPDGGSGGDIKVDGGIGYNGSEGGTIKIRGGQGQSGNAGSAPGGFVEIRAGDGNIGAPVTITAGAGNSQANGGNITLNTTYGGQWRFDNYGNLTTPGGMVINGSINVFGTQTALIQPSNNIPLGIVSSGANGSISSVWVDNISDPGNSNVAGTYVGYQGNANIRLISGNNASTVNIWDFGPDGELYLPSGGRLGFAGKGWTGLDGGNGNAVSLTSFYANGYYAGCITNNSDGNIQISTYTGNGLQGSWIFENTGTLTVSGNINGSGASPAPSISNFSSISGVDLEAANTVTATTFVGNQANVDLVADTYTWTFDTTGTLKTPGNITGPASYNQPGFITPYGGDPFWSYGIYNSGSDYWMQTRFYGQNQTTRGFRVLEAEGNTVVFSVNGVGNTVSSGGFYTNTGNITTGAGTLRAPNVVITNSVTFTGPYGNALIDNHANISTTGNITGANLITSGLISATGTVSTANVLTVSYSPPTTTGSAVVLQGANTLGGTGYFDALKLTNLSGNTTNGNKFIRLDNSGSLQIVDSNYGNTIFGLTNSGNLTTKGTIVPGAYASGQVITMQMLANSQINMNAGNISTDGTVIAYYNYTCQSSSSYLVIDFNSRWQASGGSASTDTLGIGINIANTEVAYSYCNLSGNSGAARLTSGGQGLLPIMGRATSTGAGNVANIQIKFKNISTDDQYTFSNDTSAWLKITEIAQ